MAPLLPAPPSRSQPQQRCRGLPVPRSDARPSRFAWVLGKGWQLEKKWLWVPRCPLTVHKMPDGTDRSPWEPFGSQKTEPAAGTRRSAVSLPRVLLLGASQPMSHQIQHGLIPSWDKTLYFLSSKAHFAFFFPPLSMLRELGSKERQLPVGNLQAQTNLL